VRFALLIFGHRLVENQSFGLAMSNLVLTKQKQNNTRTLKLKQVEEWVVDSDKLTFKDHQAAELLHLRAKLADAQDTIMLLKEDMKQLTEAYYKVLQKSVDKAD